jgi:hypothetical protein
MIDKVKKTFQLISKEIFTEKNNNIYDALKEYSMELTIIKIPTFTLACLIGLTACNNPNAGQEAGIKVDQAVVNAEIKIGEISQQMLVAGDRAGAEVKNATISTKIKAAFVTESAIKSQDINVNTLDGVVTLTGSADSLENSQKAEAIARGVSEVKQVNNQLVINHQNVMN